MKSILIVKTVSARLLYPIIGEFVKDTGLGFAVAKSMLSKGAPIAIDDEEKAATLAIKYRNFGCQVSVEHVDNDPDVELPLNAEVKTNPANPDVAQSKISQKAEYVRPTEIWMNALTSNPFRVIGVLAGVETKELAKQQSKIQRYLEIGKESELTFDSDFPVFGNIERSSVSIQRAFSEIELTANKVKNGLFWFVNGSHLDEPAFNYLKAGDVNKSIEIWTKITASPDVTSRNYSAFNNLGTLKIALSRINGNINCHELGEGIGYKLKLIESEGIKFFAHKVADETYKIDAKEQAIKFVDDVLGQLAPYIGKDNGIALNAVPSLFTNGSVRTRQYVTNYFIETPTINITKFVEDARKKRDENVAHSIQVGETLYADTKEDLSSLKALIGVSDIQYQMSADKLANEILQCGIAYFNEYHESNAVNLETDILRLEKYAESIAVGSITRDRIKENIEVTQEWLKNKPERDKLKKIEPDLQFVSDMIDRFENLPESVANAIESKYISHVINRFMYWNETLASAKNLLVSCKPKLENIKAALGVNNELYLNISSRLINDAQSIIISTVNQAQDNYAEIGIDKLKDIIDKAYYLTTNVMSSFEVLPEVRSRMTTNRGALEGIRSQIHSLADSQTGSRSIIGKIIKFMGG